MQSLSIRHRTRAVVRSAVSPLSDALRRLHAALVEDTKLEYERLEGKVTGRGDLLVLLTEDAAFSWLRPLSGLMAEIDDADDRGDEEALADAMSRLEDLLAPESTFAARYLDVLQRNPEAILAHGAVRGALRGARLLA